MRVRREDDRVRHAGAKLGRDMALRFRPDLVHDAVPFAVGKAGGVIPAFDLPLEACVRPEMMAVRGHVQPRRVGPEASREQMLEVQSSVLSVHSSGKARFRGSPRR